MLITENVTINDVKFVKHYSDAGMMIKQNETEALYIEAYDLEGSEFTYTETDSPIDDGSGDEEPTEADYAAAGRILLGAE